MHVKETNEIRELTTAELDEVAGGLDPVSMLFGAAIALGAFGLVGGLLDWLFDIEL